MPPGCSLQADNSFGPTIDPGCRDGFDFTLLFEQAILGLVPAVAFLLVCPPRLRFLIKRDVRTQPHIMRLAKLIAALIFAAIQLALLISWAKKTRPNTKVSMASSAVNLAVAVEIVVLTWVEDERSVRPSSLLAIYLLFTLLFDAVQTRTLWLSHGNILIPSLFTASVAAKTVMVLFESLGKQKHLMGPYQDLPPESTSGIVNRSFMWWLNRLFFRGFRSMLTTEDLDHLDKPLESAGTAQKALRAWALRRRPERRFEFPWQMGRAFKGPLTLTILPRLFLIGITFSQPFLITSILNWLDNSHSANNDGYGLIGATLLIYFGMALSNLIYDQRLYRFVTMFRGAASSMIYDHALHIPDGTLGDRSTTITLITTDVDRVITCLITLNEFWARTIEVGFGIALLALQLGWVCLIPLVVVLISSGGSIYISKHIGGHQRIWVDAVQQRIAITRSMLDGIQTVKATGLGQTLIQLVQRKRAHETHQMAKYRWSVVWKNMIQNLPWALAPALTFVAYAAQGNELNVTKVFSSLSIITLLTNPASKLLSAIPTIAAATGSFDRIQAFLLLETDPQHMGEGFFRTRETEADASPHTAGAQYMTFKGSPGTTDLRTPVISMENLSIRPSSSAKIVLRGINLEVPLGALVLIRGPVGSGKSTLLRAILGQAVCETGSTTVTTRQPAFCAQTPWVPSGTIRDTICGTFSAGPVREGAFDKRWYETVLHACALNLDLDLLREGDATRIGHGSGHVLSGGQMHRIALARAVYSRRKLLLLDDIFSALDRKTKTAIIARLLGGDGLLRKVNSTIVLVTHEMEQLYLADQIYVLSDGHLHQEEPCEGKVYQDIGYDAVEAKESKGFTEVAIEDKAAMISEVNEIDDLRRAAGDSAVYMYYWRYVGWTKAVVFVFFVTMNVFSSTYSQIWLERWADHGGARKALYVTVYIFLAICNTVGNGGYVWAILILISPSTARRLHYVVLRTVIMATPQFLATVDMGSILNRFSQDMTLIESDLPIGILITVSNLFSSIASAALIATGSKYMAVSVPFLIIVVFFLQHFYLKTSRQLRLLDLESRSPLYSHLLDTVEGLATIQAFGWEIDFRMANSTLLDVTQRTYYMLSCIQRWLTLVLDLVVAAEAVIVVSLAVALRHTTSVGLLGVSLNSILAFNGSLSALTSGWTQLEISLGSILRVKDFELTVPREISTEQEEIPVDWPGRGRIEVSGMAAQYSSETTVLSDVSLKCLPGQKIGICGRTGSGKSSLLLTLLGMLTVTHGSIIIDDIDLATLPPDIVRERLVTISQTPLIMVGCTVRFNLDPTESLPDTDIITALVRVGLWDGVLLERGGLDAEITDTLSLSRGEQQLLQFARAMLKIQARNSRILLIDEGTSSVDMETDARVQDLLRQDPFRSCTVLTVAHRVHSLLAYDLIVGLDRGKVVEIDEPLVLSNRKDSIFRDLLNSGGY
ncbi:P-loop containing nucleoside triphosphate hydrolase protein [Aspergillus caelatus]|uniref:P-loop containing nucleoside triphosphate hydrolase protein n=1 Tax=Aspergillus caelatus TaxID=61420 RepID=A0A5N7AGX3_9EURO|nr:P-loop containing nucleoside triphosphate hydrolase protein [Aspergillus caelatus]KAE8368538.1 P-loop containing nucleoside triphosphate hydrolase protein [Aspergillus caelatus]